MNQRDHNESMRRWLLVGLACMAAVMLTHPTFGQARVPDSEAAPFCNSDHALDSIRAQIDASKLIDDTRRRIAVMIRAADLLWPFDQEKARAVFTDAFEIAQQDENEKRAKAIERRSLIMAMESPDQRYVVIRALTKRDPAWARKLNERAAQINDESSNQESRQDSFTQTLSGQKMLDAATQLVAADSNAALDLARASLRYPASFMLGRFLYKLAETNQRAADAFYEQALAIYSDHPMREFLYLSAYPFSLSSSRDMPVSAFYAVPEGFAINNSLQRRFVATLIRRAEQALVVPLDDGDNFNGLPGLTHILQIIYQIEAPVRQYVPDLAQPLGAAREKLLVSLPAETQEIFGRRDSTVSESKAKSFAEKIDEAEKLPSANARDDRIVDLIMTSSEDLSEVLKAVDKISDADLQQTLSEWLYFNRAQDALKHKRLGEAERLARELKTLEPKAYLRLELSKELVKRAESQLHARELIDEAASEIDKVAPTVFGARILLTASNLYAKLDLNRSISILAEAIKMINRLEAPEFTAENQTSIKQMRRKTSGRFVFRFHMPGLDAETAFHELAKLDFNDVLTQAATFTDKFQRAMTTLAVAEVCLQEAAGREKPKKAGKL